MDLELAYVTVDKGIKRVVLKIYRVGGHQLEGLKVFLGVKYAHE